MVRQYIGPAFSLRFPADLLDRVDAAAEEAGVSRAEFLRQAAERETSRRGHGAKPVGRDPFKGRRPAGTLSPE